MYLEHWIPVPGINTSNNNNLTPRSTPNIIQPCRGCRLHFPYYIGNQTPKCILKMTHQAAITIQILPHHRRLRNDLQHVTQTFPKNIQFYTHYRILTYNDYLIQRNLIPSPQTFHHTPVNLQLITAQNHALINRLINEREIREQLYAATKIINNFNSIELILNR
ncbi:unnamed protein product [Rhizophagus irregularis]|nr:unnamed protein product [Rhizophagus irregularis]